jgi:thiamine biosynthesis lipoprotein
MKQSVLVLFLAAGLCTRLQAGEPLRIESTIDAMGGPVSIVLYGEDRDRLERAVEDAFEEVRRIDQLLSNYRPASEWSKVNRLASSQAVPVSEELFGLLSACAEYSRASGGAFDITVGPLMKVWGFYKGTGRLPEKEEVAAALRTVGWQNVILDRADRTVRFRRPGIEIDPGGVGKGYAVGRVVALLRKAGIESGLISAGGSSIYGLGAPPGEPGWKVEIRDPKDETKVAAEVVLKNESMSTSGNYEKFFVANGKLYSHIMDPRSGFPAEGMLAVSVIAPDPLDSEVWAKPYYILGRRWAEANKKKDFRVLTCEDGTPHRCEWIQ